MVYLHDQTGYTTNNYLVSCTLYHVSCTCVRCEGRRWMSRTAAARAADERTLRHIPPAYEYVETDCKLFLLQQNHHFTYMHPWVLGKCPLTL